MNHNTSFSVTRNGAPIQSVEFGSSVVRAEQLIDVTEAQPYGFEVMGREPNLEYGVWIGDLGAESGQGSTKDVRGTALGIARGRYVLWDDAAHFEGARGVVWVRLASRTAGSSELWCDRVLLPLVVLSTKLSEARYRTMYSELHGLASGLILDLISKSFRTLALTWSAGRPTIRSNLMELRILEQLWPSLASALESVAAEPVRDLKVVQELRNCWGSERFSPRSVGRLVMHGIDPRRRGLAVPFPAWVERVIESDDTIEHRVIAGFLEFLVQRLEECGDNIRRQIQAIEKDRPFRQRRSPIALSLYEIEDLPRIRRLETQQDRALRLKEQIHRARRIGPLRRVRADFQVVNTPVFQNVGPYHRIRHEIERYLHAGLLILDEGTDERVKSTSRMYEQWAFLQIVAAFREAGLRCVGRQGLLHSTKRFRFTLDFDRGARVTFLADDGRSISVRYEPWILPEIAAQQTRDTVYRGRTGQYAWSPDILIEFLDSSVTTEGPVDVDYAVVLDPKYAVTIRDHHWDGTDKYLEIRATRSRRQVVRQLWLIHPSEEDDDIALRDPTLTWTSDGPSCPRDETVHGMLRLLPSDHPPDDFEAMGWIARPVDTAVRFVTGLLNYVGVKNRGGI